VSDPLVTSGCDKCKHIPDRQDVPHCVRKCEACGRVMYVHEPGDHGIGFKIRKGDQVVIPQGWLKISFNPLGGSGRLTKHGLQWFAEMIFLEQLLDRSKQGAMYTEMERAEATCIDRLRASPLLKGLDPAKDSDVEQIAQLVLNKKETVEFWYLLEATFLRVALQAIDQGMASDVAWATACAERSRAMHIYKEFLEEVIWMGHSASRLIEFLNLWDQHQTNGDEEFWQIKFTEHSYVLSQAFSAPVVLIRERAYVGGMNLDRKDARFVDYLFSTETSRDALLIELKTPVTKLLGAKYRSVYGPSRELNGAVVQLLDYRRQLAQDLESVKRGTGHELRYFNPRCLLLAGNGQAELGDPKKRESFEVFRSGLKDVEILTYDELFRKIAALARLFNLVQRPSPKTDAQGEPQS
jgi:hypothetical protein